MPHEPSPPDPEALLQHRSFLRALARNLLADEHLAEDVVQESFVLALTRPPRAADSLRSWLARVVERQASNRRRGESRRRWREGETARREEVPSAGEVSESLGLQRRVLATLDGLHEPYKTAIYLRWYEGLPPREIARRLEVPVETVRSRIKRGLAKMRAELDGEFGERDSWALLLWPLGRPERSTLLSSGALITAVSLGIAILVVALSNRWRLSALQERSPATAMELARGPMDAPATPGAEADRAGAAPGRLSIETPPPPPTTAAPSVARTAPGPAPPAETPVGPSFELDLDLPPGLEREELRARLSWIDDGNKARSSAAVPIREGTPPWVAFAEPPPISLTTRGARTTYLLRVESHDGQWGASARVHSIRGPYPVLVPLRLEARGNLVLRLRGEDGAPVEGARVRARASGGGGPPLRRHSDEQGRCRFFALEPGRWNVTVDSVAHFPLARELEVTTGGRVENELSLVARPAVPVRGRLWSRSGAELSPAPLRLRSTETPGHTRLALPEADPEHPGTWVFDFGPVPMHEYVLLPPEGSPFAWDPPLRRVSGAELAADFECLDGESTRAIRFRAFDRKTGERLESFETTLLVDRYGLGARGCAELERPLQPRVTRFDELPWGAADRTLPVHWLVECPGYQAVQGDDAELIQRGEEWILEVRLAPAWGATFWAGTIDGKGQRVPLAGAQLVTSEGRELGSSLEDGFLRLDISFDPGALRFELDGWRLFRWEGFREGRPAEEREVYEAWFEKTE